jgi:hypothetical protein
MAKRLPPLFEAGIYGCPFCGSPDIEFRNFRQEDRTFLIAGQCHGIGEATEIHRWVVMLTMRPNGMRVRIEPLHDGIAFPGRPTFNNAPMPQTSASPGLTIDQLIKEVAALKVLGTNPTGVILHPRDYDLMTKTELEQQLEASLRALGVEPSVATDTEPKP